MCQSGQGPQQVRQILLRLRDARVTVSDWNCLMTQTPLCARFVPLLTLLYTSFQLLKLLLSTILLNRMPVASLLPPVHTGANALKAPADDAGGLKQSFAWHISVLHHAANYASLIYAF